MAQSAEPKDFLGKHARDFTAPRLDEGEVKLSALYGKGPVVFVMLRGWPGYQCPICSRQVGEFIMEADRFKGAHVVFLYPGPAEKLKEHAGEFSGKVGKDWPDNFIFAIDPDYHVTNLYGIRWDKKRETAYPATLVIDSKGVVRFAEISSSHGGRVKASKAAEELGKVR